MVLMTQLYDPKGLQGGACLCRPVPERIVRLQSPTTQCNKPYAAPGGVRARWCDFIVQSRDHSSEKLTVVTTRTFLYGLSELPQPPVSPSRASIVK